MNDKDLIPLTPEPTPETGPEPTPETDPEPEPETDPEPEPETIPEPERIPPEWAIQMQTRIVALEAEKQERETRRQALLNRKAAQTKPPKEPELSPEEIKRKRRRHRLILW